MDGYRFTIDKRVRYSETDAVGIVNNLAFFHYFEIARTEYWREAGVILTELKQGELAISMAHQECDYILPVYPDELLEVGGRTASIGEKSLVTEYRICRKATGEVVAEGGTVHVAVEPRQRGRSTPVPESVRRRLSEYEGTDF